MAERSPDFDYQDETVLSELAVRYFEHFKIQTNGKIKKAQRRFEVIPTKFSEQFMISTAEFLNKINV